MKKTGRRKQIKGLKKKKKQQQLNYRAGTNTEKKKKRERGKGEKQTSGFCNSVSDPFVGAIIKQKHKALV